MGLLWCWATKVSSLHMMLGECEGWREWFAQDLQTPALITGFVKGFGAGRLFTEGLGGSDAGEIVSCHMLLKLHLSGLEGLRKG